MATSDTKNSDSSKISASEPATHCHIPDADSCSAFCRSKRDEWFVKCVYPRADKIDQLLLKLYYLGLATSETAKARYYSFDSKLHVEFAETLRLLGWISVEATDAKALDGLKLTHDSLLLAGPEVVTALRQREDHCRFACCLAYWEQKLPCLKSYWTLHDTLESFEQSLQMFSRMGLLGDAEGSAGDPRRHRISYGDILLPTVHLGEVWGRKLSLFLKAHDYFRVKHVSGPAQASNSGASSPGDLVYQPAESESSGRKRLEVLMEKLAENYGCGTSDSGAPGWSGLILQAYPETHRMLVTGRQFTLETFLLLAPRRNSLAFGFVAFFHPGLVRVSASADPDDRRHRFPDRPSAAADCNSNGQTFVWIPDQLSDYLAAVDPDHRDWLKCTAYPQLEAASAYLATALTRQLLDSALNRFHLLRLSFVVDAKRRQPRLADISQHVASPAAAPTPDADYCESLVVPRLLQEAALIVAELLVRSSREPSFPARRLVTPHNMKLVFDSAEPAVQRDILSGATRVPT